MTYAELLQKYETLRLENEALRKENANLRAKLGMIELKQAKTEPTIENNAITVPEINKYSPVDEKIGLFMSLFAGREDVYAKRWYSAKTGKSGYQPVCGNEWDGTLCNKQQYKCNVCPNRNLLPLDKQAIYEHLSGKDINGKDVVGIFPMLIDETCRFLAVDFDDGHYEEEALAFKHICEENNVPAYIERSRSGSGAHVWIFFSEAIPASVARKLGSGLLTQAMNKQSRISFSSYDRLFPNQDTMPDGGFGNLIALPLQGQARKNGNSLFVDDDFIPYPDQWAFLASVQKVSAEEVNAVIERICPHNELGELVKGDEEKPKPWESKKKTKLEKSDFPVVVNVTQANMLYIEKAGISHKAINKLRRLAAFKNPDFYRSRAMRLPIYNKPRVICSAEDTDKYIGLPRGCMNGLIALFDEVGVAYTIDDKTNAGNAIDVAFDGELRDEQKPATEALLEYNNGVLSATTAFGKTVIGSYLIAERKTNTLILVHTAALLEQWKQSLGKFLTINAEPPIQEKKRGRKKAWSVIGTIGSGKQNPSGIVDVAIMQSLHDGDEVKELVRNYGMIIIDECHHAPALNFEKILKYADAKYVYGLSATPTRQDGHHPLLFMQCGPIRYLVDAKSQAEKRSFSHTVIPRFTSFRSAGAKEKTITQIYAEIVQSDIRNRQIVDDALYAIAQSRTPVILTERKEHVSILAELLSDKCTNIISLVGTMSAKKKRETMQRLEAIPANEPLILIATGKYIGEGFDYPRLDTLLLAMPIAWKGKVAQYAGRLHRGYDGKTEVQIFDYVDIHVPVLERMYQKRLKSYATIGYQAKSFDTDIDKASILYDGRSFLPVFYNDIDTAGHEIIIVSPFMRKSRITKMLKKLAPIVQSGVSVTAVTRPPENFPEVDRKTVEANATLLTDAGITVKYRSGFHQKFTVIDNRIIWYGSVNFLSFGSNEESIMRLESQDIAEQLLDSIS